LESNGRKRLKENFSEAHEKYTDLTLAYEKEAPIVRGDLKFTAEYESISLNDIYKIEIVIPVDYPNSPPLVKETGGKIPRDFHKYPDGYLCLAAPLEVRQKFNQNKTLLGFIDSLLIPYLYSYSFLLKYNKLPYGELSHGFEGILESYKGIFGVSSEIDTMSLLKVLAEDNYRGHINCPCGSGERLRNCHGQVLLKIKNQQSKKSFFTEYFNLLLYLFPDVKDAPRKLISKRLLNDLKRYSTH